MHPEKREELEEHRDISLPPFEVGDVVMLKSGGLAFSVLEQVGTDRVRIEARYGGVVVKCEVSVMDLEKVEKNN